MLIEKDKQSINQDNLLALLELYYHNPVLFAEQVLNVQLDEQQIDVINELYNHKRVTVKSGKGPGKTYVAAVLVWHFLVTRYNSQVYITSPGAGQIAAGIWTKITSLHDEMNELFKGDWEVLSTKIANKKNPHNWFCMVRTARRENPQALYGAHADNMLYILDEASGIPDENYYSIKATLTQDNNYMLLLGNPDRLSGFFYESHQPRLSTLYKQLTLSCYKSKWVSRDSIEEKRIEYGENSNRFRVEVLGDFPKSEQDAIINAELVQAAMDREIQFPEGLVYWGIDVGGTTDKTVFLKRQGNKVFDDIKEWKEPDTMKIVGRILKEYNDTPKRMKPDAIFVDNIGLGQGLADRLKELKLPVVKATASNNAIKKKYFVNAKAEMWFNMRKWFQTEQPDIPRNILLAEQLYTMQNVYHSSGRLCVEDKHQYRRRMNGKSPDLADALALTFYEGKNKKASESLFFI